MAEAGIRDYPRDEIIQHHAELQQLLLDMAARSAGGRRASGRYKAYDTARLLYIKKVFCNDLSKSNHYPGLSAKTTYLLIKAIDLFKQGVSFRVSSKQTSMASVIGGTLSACIIVITSIYAYGLFC